MPTITVKPLEWAYHEEAGCDSQWSVESINQFGLRSHRFRPNYGSQFFAIYGGRSAEDDRIVHRFLDYFPNEGPHVSFQEMIVQPMIPVGAAVTDARVWFTAEPNSADPTRWLKVFTVMETPYRARRISREGFSYPTTYRQEFFPQVGAMANAGWGRYRRYRADSDAWTKRHSEAVVPWDVSGALVASQDYSSPNIAAAVNEVLALPSWQPGATLCVVVMPHRVTPGIEPYAFDPSAVDVGSGSPLHLGRPWATFTY